jgi:hypothetical protein
MLRDGLSFDDAYAKVKAARGIASPNMGFACQLLHWGLRQGCTSSPRLYRATAQSAADPRYLICRCIPRPQCGIAWLRRGAPALVLHSTRSVWAWRAADCPPAYWEAALRFAQQLTRYENAAEQATVVLAGSECEAPGFMDALDDAGCLSGEDVSASEAAAAAQATERARIVDGLRCEEARRGGVGAQDFGGERTRLIPRRSSAPADAGCRVADGAATLQAAV